MLFFLKPEGQVAWVCTKQDTYPDEREFVGVGIQPDLVVKKTVKDYRENRDPLLEAAVKQLENKI
jgi:C-terminal processing protease CtpA/Prc